MDTFDQNGISRMRDGECIILLMLLSCLITWNIAYRWE